MVLGFPVVTGGLDTKCAIMYCECRSIGICFNDINKKLIASPRSDKAPKL